VLNRKFKLKTKDFVKYKKGEVINTPFFRITKHQDKETKIATVISKKYIKKANKRNELKRKICYAYYELFKTGKIKENVFIITLIKKENKDNKKEEVEDFKYQEIKKQLEALIN
jgi:ribonuclease P protein component